MAIDSIGSKYFLGSVTSNIKVLSSKVNEIIASLNSSISTIALAVTGATTLTGSLTFGRASGYWIAIKGPADHITVPTGGAITAAQLLTGHINITGATGNVALPSVANITAALGTASKGASFNFIINAIGMTAANIVTLSVGANTSVLSTPIIIGSDTLTVAQAAQGVGRFTYIYDSDTTAKIIRIA